MKQHDLFRKLSALLIPGGVVFILFAFAFGFHQHYLRAVSLFIAVYPYLFFVGGCILGLFFQRNRQALFLIIIGISDRMLFLYSRGNLADPYSTLLIQIIIVLIPLTLFIAIIIPDRRLISVPGSISLIWIGIPVAIIMFCYHFIPDKLNSMLNYKFTNLFQINLAGNLSYPIITIYLVVFLFFLGRFFRNSSIENSSFLWSFVCIFIAISVEPLAVTAKLYFGVSGAILFVSILFSTYRMAYHDDLTGLPGRRALNQMLCNVGTRFSIAMVDIDHFKKVNDRFGHDIGDQILRMVSTKLMKVGAGGKTYRYGGEEFSIIFPGKTVEDVQGNLNKIRKNISSNPFYVRTWRRSRTKSSKFKKRTRKRKKINVKISIGLAQSSSRYNTAEQVIKAADKALYRAKKAGRNRLIVAGRRYSSS